MTRIRPLSCAALVSAALAAGPVTAEQIRLGADVDAGTLDPRVMRNTTAYRVNNLLYDGLVQLDASLQPKPDLAESWTNPEPTVWIFTLREGVKFHDGTELDADDVVFTFETILDPDLKARFRSLFTPIETIEAVDARTVKITLKEPYAPLLSYLDMGIVPRDYVEGGGDLSSNPVGTGPLKLTNWERGTKIVLEPFSDHWSGAPEIDGFEFVVVGDNTARAQAFEAGDLDIIQSPLIAPGHRQARCRRPVFECHHGRSRDHLPQHKRLGPAARRRRTAQGAVDARRPGHDREPDLRGRRPGCEFDPVALILGVRSLHNAARFRSGGGQGCLCRGRLDRLER